MILEPIETINQRCMNIKHTLITIGLSAAFLMLMGCNSSLQQPETQSSTPVGSAGGIPSIPPSAAGNESGDSAGSSPGTQAGSQETGSAGMPSGTGQTGELGADGSADGGQTGASNNGVSAGVGGMDGSSDASGADQSVGQDSGSMAGVGGMTGSIGGQEMGSQRTGSNGAGSGGLDDVFNKSLGDFDEEMGREQAGTQGSAGATERREAADENSVRTAGMKGGSIGGMDNAGGMSGSSSSGSMSGGATGQSGGADSSGSGPDGEGMGEGAGEGPGRSAPDDEKVANLPDDITVDERAEDQVARQIREAAMAEEDAVIREALWDEYRKHMGMK